jgi:hypothetical protein
LILTVKTVQAMVSSFFRLNQPMKWLDIREHPKNMVDSIFNSGASQPQEAALMSEKARFIQPLGAKTGWSSILTTPRFEWGK